MKNLKRLLSLVVVMALLCALPLTVSAAGADNYTDSGDITYTEAVDVLTGIGVLQGLTDGSYGPDRTMTRAEAAKIIAYLLLGDSAENLSAVTAPFDDVAADHWAAGYIAYCANAGIINGNGAGSFLPDQEVTAYQFGKMLLTAVGYGVNGEYTGSGWEIAVASDASALGIYDGLVGSLAGSQPMTRDEMALYAFNTLVGVAQVNYNSVFGEYYIGTSALTAVDNDVDPTDTDSAYRYTLGYQNYGLLMKQASGTDAFGRPYYYWTQNGAALTDGYTSSDADYVYDNGVSQSTLYSALGRSVATSYTFAYIVDGVELDTTDGPARGSSADVAGEAGDGSYVEVYVDDVNEDVTVIIVHTYLGQITDVDDSDADAIVYTVEVYGEGANDMDATSLDITTADSGYAEDDYVLVTAASEDDGASYELQSIALADIVSGAVTTYGSYYTAVDGVTCYHSDKFVYGADKRDTSDFEGIYTFYLDNSGNIIGMALYSGSAASLNYLYVAEGNTNSYAAAYSALSGEAYVAVAVTFVDGTSDVIYLRVNNATSSSATFYNPSVDDDSDEVIGTQEITTGYGVIDAGWYSYTVNTSGYYTLKELDADETGTAVGITTDGDTSAVKFTDSDENTVTRYANSSTELVYVDSGATYTGYTNFPSKSYDSDDGVSVLYVTSGANSTRLTNIYVVGTGSTSVDVTFAMFAGLSGTTSDGYNYVFYVDGVSGTYLFDSSLSGVSGYDVGFLVENSDGYYDFHKFDGADNDYFASSSGYYVYTGVVTASESDYLVVDSDSDGDDDYNFALADSYEATRINASESLTSGRAQEGDKVYVFATEVDDGAAEAYAVFAIDGDVAGTDEGEDETATDGIYGLYQGTIGSRYKFYVDGKTTTYQAAGDVSLSDKDKNSAFELTLNEDGQITKVTKLSNNQASTDGYYATAGLSVEDASDSTYLSTKASEQARYLIATDAVVYDTTGDGATAVAKGDTITVIRSAWENTSNYEATAYIIYITTHQTAEDNG